MKAQGILSVIVRGIICVTLLTGCPTTQEQITEQVRVGVYATHDSMDVSRYDLAKKYSAETIRMVPPPQRRMVIKALEQIQQEEQQKQSTVSKIKGKFKKTPRSTAPRKSYVVLPEGTDTSMILVENSPQFILLKAHDSQISAQLATEQKNIANFKKTNDDTLRKQAKELEELRAYKAYHGFFATVSRWFHRILGWGSIGLIILAIAGVICFFAFPEVWWFFAAILKASARAINGIFGVLKWIVQKFTTKKS